MQCKEKVSDCESDAEDHKNVGNRNKVGSRLSSEHDVKEQPPTQTFVAVTNSNLTSGTTTILPANATPISILTPTSINKPKPLRHLPSDSALTPVLTQTATKLVFQPAGGAFRSVPSPKDPMKVSNSFTVHIQIKLNMTSNKKFDFFSLRSEQMEFIQEMENRKTSSL